MRAAAIAIGGTIFSVFVERFLNNAGFASFGLFEIWRRLIIKARAGPAPWLPGAGRTAAVEIALYQTFHAFRTCCT